MKLAFIADIHANIVALEEVLKRIKEPIFCCGDLVGYNPFPNEVVERVEEEKITCILGNHDFAVITGDTSWFNPAAAEAIEWTRKRINRRSLEFLKSLPRRYSKEFHMVHGSPRNELEEYVFSDYPDYVLLGFFEEIEQRTLVLGHTHRAFVKPLRNKLILNPGSVGQPRDFDLRAAYALFDTETREVEIKRVHYDVKKVADEILAQGLPAKFAARLYEGW